MARVAVTYCLSGDNIDFDQLSESIGIIPSKTRKKEEWPEVSQEMKLATDEWIVRIPHEKSSAIAVQFCKLESIIYPSVQAIREAIGKFSLTSTLIISVEMGAKDSVEMVLSKENIAFSALVLAEVGIDLYYD